MNRREKLSIVNFIKKEPVLTAAALLAIISAFWVHPSKAYFEYLDMRVLALLFSLMIVVKGMQSIGLFRYLGEQLLSRVSSGRQIALCLVLLCFFSSMFITNDVALITFVPFAILTLKMSARTDLLIPVIVLQTIAANLGSMLTPVGNPQNLYLYSSFDMSFVDFVTLMLPLTALSLVMLLISIRILPDMGVFPKIKASSKSPDKRSLAFMIALFIVCLLCVLRVISWPVMILIVIVAFFIKDKELFLKIDLFLLLTFVCFFIFIGNMGELPQVRMILDSFIEGRELLLGIAFSQVISNVPAAILLSGFTENQNALLFGVNVGGLGTIIASLASLISYRFFLAEQSGLSGRYMRIFTTYNLIFLIPLAIVSALLS